MLAFTNVRLILFPDLFPGLAFATPFFQVIIGRSTPGQNPAIKKRVVSFMHQAGKRTPSEQGGTFNAYTLPGHALTVHHSPFPKLSR